MLHEVASTCLIEHLSEGGFRSSVMATYSCYFPFYEEVVLRRLMTAGCTHNVLMVDATRCAEAFASNELRPLRAGRDYTLIPVRVGGAFHPKIFLRFGKSKGSLLVGSHNVTLAGFGLNDEVTNVFQLEGPAVRSGGLPLRKAFDYLAKFVPSSLPDVAEAYDGLKLGIPWIGGPLGAGSADRTLLTSSSADSALWSQVLPFVPKDVSTAFICGPFFDPALALVRRVQRDVRPRELVIGIDPSSAEIDPDKAAALPEVRWVNIAGVPPVPLRREGSAPYVHAKLLWFLGNNEQLLVTGSANPSVAAFLAPGDTRNAEAIVADRRIGAGDELGIDALIAAPPVTPAEWKAVAKRRADKTKSSNEHSRRVLVAVPTPQGFQTQESLAPGTALRGIGDSGVFLGDGVVRDEIGTSIEAPELVRDGARYLQGESAAEHLFVIVHRTEDIAKNLGGDTRKALRQAIGAIEDGSIHFEEFLKLAEKVIFDSDDIVRSTPLRTADSPDSIETPAAPAASLALDAAGRKAARRRRTFASGDIVVLLDALLHRLGEGLPASAAPRPPNDQDEVGKDEEDGGELAHQVQDHELLAKLCRGKVRRLIKRMVGQFDVAAAPQRARRGVIQLAAVLSVIRTLRLIGHRPEWRRKHLELVDSGDERRLFESAVLHLTWGDDSLAKRALAEADGEWFRELSLVVGLLAWLAWDVGVDAEAPSNQNPLEPVERTDWRSVQLLALVGTWLAEDANSAAVLQDSVCWTPRRGVDGNHWLATHTELVDGIALVETDPDHYGRLGRDPRPGELVVLTGRETPRVRVVLDVRPAGNGTKVVLFDPAGKGGERSFLSARVATLQWPRRQTSSQVSA